SPPLGRISDVRPVGGLWRRVALEVQPAAGARQRQLVWEVAVDRHPSDTRALGDVAERRRRGADRLVQLDRRLDDATTGLMLLLGTALQLVAAIGHLPNDDT